MLDKSKISVLHLEDDLNDSELVLIELETLAIKIDYIRVDCEKDFRYHLENNQFDIILADYNLPTFDGISALRICSEKYPDIPFIIVSGTLGEEKAVQMLKYGASDYLLKQNLKRLASAVVQSLEQARLKINKLKTEKELRESEEKFRTITENSADAIFVTDQTGRYVFTNNRVTEMLGFSREEMINKKITDLATENQSSKFITIYNKLISEGKATGELELLKKDGSIIPVDLNAVTLPNGFLYGSCRDNTERIKAIRDLEEAKDKAEESDRLKTAFLHNISHEIRTPMNAIIGFSSILGEDDATSEKQKSFINAIQDGSTQLLSIINDIVDISSIEANILKKSITKVNVNDILEILYNQFQLRASENSNSIKFTSGLSNENAILDTDNTKLIQILSNLINNALKFTKNGKIEFGYQVKKSMVEFFVSDTGIGIADDQHLRIFNNFYQIENGLSKQYGGTGLGLAISKAYTELLGGKIWLQSEPGKGSTFYFNIPYIRSQPEVQRKSEIKENKDFRFLYPVRFLIAEDNDQNFNLISHQLSDPNVQLVRAINGQEAVELCKSHNFDLIVMDLKMPVMDGYTATENIKVHFPHLPVIAQTAFVTEKENALTCGCDDFLSKPFNKEEILSIVHKHLKIKTQ